MKVVLDTNVFISGIFWSGSPQRVVSLWAESKIQLLISPKILDEYIRILHKIDQSGDIARKWGAFVLETATFVEDKELVHICRDAEDNKFLNCVLVGGADYLVSGDDDLLSLKKIGAIEIITPSQFLKKYRREAH